MICGETFQGRIIFRGFKKYIGNPQAQIAQRKIFCQQPVNYELGTEQTGYTGWMSSLQSPIVGSLPVLPVFLQVARAVSSGLRTILKASGLIYFFLGMGQNPPFWVRDVFISCS